MIKKILLTLIILSFCIYPTLAETFDETFSEYNVNVYEFTYNTGSNDFRSFGDTANVLSLHLPQHPANYNGLRFCSFESNKVHIKKDGAYLTTPNQIPCIFTGASTGNTYNVLMSVTTSLSTFGAYQKTYITFEFLDYADILSISDNYLKLTFPDSTYTVSIDTDYHNPSSGGDYWSHSVYPTITSSSGDTNNEIRIGGYSAGPGSAGYVEPTGQKSKVITNAIWENKFTSEYGDLFSQIKLTRKNFYSTLNIYDLNENLIYTEYSNSDLDFSIPYPQYMLNIISPSNTNYNKTLTSQETGKEYYLLKSKDGILAINESVTISVYPTLNYNELNRIVWNSYPVDANDNTISGESYLKNYVRYNDTHWQYTEAKNSVLISNGIIPQTELTNSVSINFGAIANYRITCNLFDKDNLNLGNPQINVNVGNAASDLLQYFIRTVDAETANGISGATLTIYKITESGEILDQTITMSGSQQEVLFSSGEIYVIRASKDGYVTNSYTFTATESKTFTIYLSKSSDDGYSTVTFIVYDANNNRLQNAIVNLNGIIKYTNQAGITTFDNLLSDCNHPYNVSLANYQSESGTIYTDNEIEELFIRLYAISEIYPTPTTIPVNMTKPSNLKESITFALASVFGISDNDNANLIFAAIIIGFFAMMAGYATHSGMGILAGACIGFILCLGLSLIPIWIFFAIVVMTIIYFVLKSGGE